MKTRRESSGQLILPLDYFDINDFKRASFPKLKPSVKSISIRLPEDMLAELKTLANKKDVPYQSLAKIYLARQISLERGSLHMASKKRGGIRFMPNISMNKDVHKLAPVVLGVGPPMRRCPSRVLVPVGAANQSFKPLSTPRPDGRSPGLPPGFGPGVPAL